MAEKCTILTTDSGGACSGKCEGMCTTFPRIWVAATAGGIVSLFEKKSDGILPLPIDEYGVCLQVGEFLSLVAEAGGSRKFSQLVIVGSAADMATMRDSLPVDVAKFIAAEIEYPLLTNWFSRDDNQDLCQALGAVFNLS